VVIKSYDSRAVNVALTIILLLYRVAFYFFVTRRYATAVQSRCRTISINVWPRYSTEYSDGGDRRWDM